jgi:uncharacterized protein
MDGPGKSGAMIKSRSPWVCLVCVLLVSIPCSVPLPARAATACVWRVTNAPAPFYLVGTIHALSGKDYPLPKAYAEALQNSQQFFFEIAPDPKDNFAKLFAASAAYPKEGDIRHHIHPETWNFLEKRFRESNYLGKGFWMGEQYLPGLQNLRPWAIAYYIWGVRGYSDLRDRLGVDNYISYQAKRMGKGRGGLETAEQHVDVLRGMADIDAELILLDSLVRGDKRRDDFNGMRAGWKKGDLGPMMADEKRARDLNLGAELRLLDYRNLRWIPKIVDLITSGIPTSIVVGTGHFCGTNSVIDLLQKKGYKIEQL